MGTALQKPTKRPKPRKRISSRPRCKHCAHSYSKHYVPNESDASIDCMRCESCPGYEPKRKTRSDKKPRGTKASDVGKAGRTLWKKFAAYVKARDGNQCFTCDAWASGVELQAGHMFPGRTGALLYDPLVVFSQCDSCNRGKRGNTAVFVQRYIERFGVEQFRAAVARTSREKKWTTPELRELIEALKRGGADYETLYMERHGL